MTGDSFKASCNISTTRGPSAFSRDVVLSDYGALSFLVFASLMKALHDSSLLHRAYEILSARVTFVFPLYSKAYINSLHQ